MDKPSTSGLLISVVIPLYKEGSHLRAFLSDLRDALQRIGYEFEVILNGSKYRAAYE
jgi:glycosyltransferase involved in cell wall biosynthesis